MVKFLRLMVSERDGEEQGESLKTMLYFSSEFIGEIPILRICVIQIRT